MGWRQWAAVTVLIGGGILLQIPSHSDAPIDHAAMGHSEELPEDLAEPHGAYTTVALDVTGMT